ncbi:farnesyl diphosphate synthase [Candidatus Oleimmundimicrobium sp.]|uniref:polyprenyl synthetase family protein n=1 Tax=Candidatus Oleimmundimicrobium sp. TaxID=3060597 RepID=UPI002724F359|nr:farnesyl diphosphate synthase [Candidatus Oleimmundimicrobium sp.]MDO8886521.1 polyprenyl synthetase family protein [Candidatus Oleimmundimicrobium sp.]
MLLSKYPEDKRLLIEDALTNFFPPTGNYPELLYKAIRYSLLSGGKRFRPILVLATAEIFGMNPIDVIPVACAIECVHTYSLIHDDLPAIDDDNIRRGKPTCHIAFGEDMAILAGDGLFAEAFYLIAKRQKTDNPSKIVHVIEELSEASGPRGMVGGQVLDILSSGKKIDLNTLKFIHIHKTGRLIRASCRIGAILAGASAKELKAVSNYAEHLGLAFQITDDILDVIGKTASLGKEPGSDERKNKATFPSIFGLEHSKELAKKAADDAKEALKDIDKDTSPLASLADFVFERDK